MATINLLAPGGSSPTAYLFADSPYSYPAANGLPAGGPGGVAQLTQGTSLVTGKTVPVSAAVEIQSTLGAFLMPRMTTAQRTVNTFLPAPGMQVYDTTAHAIYFYINNAWVALNPGGAGGNVTGPNPSTVNAIATYGNTLGTAIQNGVILVDPATGNFTYTPAGGVTSLMQMGHGTAGVPTYSFNARTNTGMWSSADDTLDFSTNGARQFQIENQENAVNFISVVGSDTGVTPANTAVFSTTNSSDAVVDIGFFPHGATGGVSILANDASAVSPLRFWNAANTFYSAIHAGVNTSNLSWTLPTVAPTAGQILSSSDTNGTLLWTNAGNVSIAGSGTANAVPTFTGVAGAIQNTPVLIAQGTGNITAAGTIHAAVGAVSAPTYSFTGDTVTGMWRSSANIISFSGNSEKQFEIRSTASAENYIWTRGASPGNAPQFNATGTDTDIDLDLITTGAGALAIYSSSGANPGAIHIYNNDADGYIGLTVAGALPVATAFTYELPTTAPTDGQILSSLASGVMSWTENVVLTTSGTITLANFIGSNATPISFIPAPGAGKMAVIIRYGLQLIYGSAPFAAGSSVVLQYGNTANAGGVAATTAIANTTVTGVSANEYLMQVGLMNILTASAVDAGIYLTYGNTAFTGGTGATFRYFVDYIVVPAT